MAHYVKQNLHTPAEELRSSLDEIEHLIASAGTPESDPRALLQTMDKAHEMVRSLQDEGVDIKPETVRFESLQGLVKKKASTIVRDLKPAGGIEPLRSQIKPSRDRWWWYLDEEIASRKRKSIARAIAIPLLIALLLFAGAKAFEYAFPPDKTAVKVSALEDEAARAIQKGDLDTALQKYEEVAQLTPDDGTVQVWIGVLSLELGDGQKSSKAFSRAEKLLKPADLHLSSGYVYFALGKPDKADRELRQAIELDPDNGMAYYLRGNVLASQRRFSEAKAMYTLAAEKADEAGDHRLEAMARVQMANVIQQESGLGAPSLPR